MIENGSLWIDTKNNKSYLRENDNWEEKDFIKELIEEKIINSYIEQKNELQNKIVQLTEKQEVKQ